MSNYYDNIFELIDASSTDGRLTIREDWPQALSELKYLNPNARLNTVIRNIRALLWPIRYAIRRQI